MSADSPELTQLLDALRDQAVGTLLEAMAHELETGAAVVPEPERRDRAGAVLRSGPLRLPRRDDLEVTRDGRSVIRRIEGGPPEPSESLIAVTGGGFAAEIHPFPWDAAELTVRSRQVLPDWVPLRRWFLEWFQTRLTEVAPDLHGAVHSLDGPEQVRDGWAFIVDFGSAPAGCVADLIAALAESGAEGMRLGYP